MNTNNSVSVHSIVVNNSDLFKYQNHFEDLKVNFQDLAKKQFHLVQQIFKKNNNSAAINLPSIDDLLDVYALKVAKKKDTYEKICTLEGICEGNEVFLVKRWKRKCRFMLEIVAELYRIYRTVYDEFQYTVPTKEEIGRVKQCLGIINDDKVAETHCTDFDKWDMMVPVSDAFLNDLITNYSNYKNELNQQVIVKDRLFYVLKKAKDQRSRLKMYVNNLRDEIRYAEKKLRETAELMTTMSMDEVSSMLDEAEDENIRIGNDSKEYYETRISELEKIIKEEETRRKHLHNKFQVLIGNIRVYCRLRPSDNCCLKISNDDKLIIPADIVADKVTKSLGSAIKCFIFDRVFDVNATQDDVFSSVDSLITSCIDGYNVCIMTYGQTGSGKTYTMVGTDDNPGINRRAIRQLMQNSFKRNQWTYKLTVSMIELYQEEVYDLLVSPTVSGSTNSNQIKIFSNKENDVILQGLVETEVEDEIGIFELLKIGENNRKVNETLLNIASSRSHLILFMKVSGVSQIQGMSSRGTLTLCDLAGSENVLKAGAMGTRSQECTIINKSLSTLGRVFDSLRKNHKPAYRESKLTHLLKPTLGGDSKCLLILTIKSELENIHDTLGTLYFGQNAMQVIPEKRQN